MNDVIDELRELNQEVPVPLELPDDDDIVLVEEQILIGLPRDYKEFLREASDVVYGSLEPATVMDPQSHTYLPEVASRAWDMGVPRHWIPVCEAPQGFYCISDEGEISLFDFSGEEVDEHYQTIWDWITDVWLAS